MIYGHISQISDEINLLPSTIKVALEHLKTDFSKLTPNQYPLKGQGMFMIIDEYRTQALSEKRSEQHKKYVDIHYIIKGQESIGFGVAHTNNQITEKYDSEKDRALFSKIHNETVINLKEGNYAIFFPSDIHRPGCHIKTESSVKKAVIKIAVKLL